MGSNRLFVCEPLIPGGSSRTNEGAGSSRASWPRSAGVGVRSHPPSPSPTSFEARGILDVRVVVGPAAFWLLVEELLTASVPEVPLELVLPPVDDPDGPEGAEGAGLEDPPPDPGAGGGFGAGTGGTVTVGSGVTVGMGSKAPAVVAPSQIGAMLATIEPLITNAEMRRRRRRDDNGNLTIDITYPVKRRLMPPGNGLRVFRALENRGVTADVSGSAVPYVRRRGGREEVDMRRFVVAFLTVAVLGLTAPAAAHASQCELKVKSDGTKVMVCI